MIGEECIQVLCLYEHGCEQLPKNQHITTKETRQKGKKFQTEIDTLQKTNKGLKANLKRHDNSNTPSSAKLPGSKKKRSKIIKPNTKKKKQGGQKGHVGKTFKPKATRTVEHKPDICNNCGSNDLKVQKNF